MRYLHVFVKKKRINADDVMDIVTNLTMNPIPNTPYVNINNYFALTLILNSTLTLLTQIRIFQIIIDDLCLHSIQYSIKVLCIHSVRVNPDIQYE